MERQCGRGHRKKRKVIILTDFLEFDFIDLDVIIKNTAVIYRKITASVA